MKRIFTLSLAALAAVWILGSNFTLSGNDWIFYSFQQAEVALVATFFIGSTAGRARSIAIFLAVFFWWITLSDPWSVNWPYRWPAMESALFAVAIAWLMLRPQRLPSAPISENVCIALYHGNNSPLIAKLASFFGLPYTGVAIIIGRVAMVPSGKTQKIGQRTSHGLPRRWTIIDTGIEPNREISGAFFALERRSVDGASCLKAIRPFLGLLGGRFAATTNSPALYARQLCEID